MARKEFLQRTIETMNRRFIGFDVRILPLLGIVSLAWSAIYWWQYRWADALLFGALFALCVFFCLSVYDVWKEDKREWENKCNELQPLQTIMQGQKQYPQKFISLEPYIVDVNKDMEIIGFQAKVRSWLFEEITVKKVIAKLKFPSKESSYREVEFVADESRKFKLDGLEKGGNVFRYLSLLCQQGGIIISTDSVNRIFRIEGNALLIRDSLPDIPIDIWGDVLFNNIDAKPEMSKLLEDKEFPK